MIYGIIKKILFILLSTNKRIIWTIVLLFLKRRGGEYTSLLLREIFVKFNKVDIGLYSRGGCFVLGNFQPCTKIGRYCTIAISCVAYNRDHPINFKSTHAFFFNPIFGFCNKELIEFIPLEIGHDVWIGENVILLPGVKTIGTGAIIGAGAIISKSVPPYAVVAGYPSKIIRFRFSPEKIDELLKSEWWNMSIDEIKNNQLEFITKGVKKEI